jgi:hypothetical protein
MLGSDMTYLGYVIIALYILLGIIIHYIYLKDRHEILNDPDVKETWMKSELQFHCTKERIEHLLKTFADIAGFVVALLWPFFLPYFIYAEIRDKTKEYEDKDKR